MSTVRTGKPVGWIYLALLIGATLVGLFHHPSAKSAAIDAPLSMPHVREVEISGAQWAVERRLETWDHIAFRNTRIARHEGRVSVCGEVRAAPVPDFRRYIETGGDVTVESSDQANFSTLWDSVCTS